MRGPRRGRWGVWGVLVGVLAGGGGGVGWAQEAARPLVDAKAFILLDAETGTVMAEHEADVPLPPASLTKIMTGYAALAAARDGVVRLDDRVVVSEAAGALEEDESRMFLRVGERVAVSELLAGVAVASGNDAAVALAEAVDGSERAFARRMSNTAAALGLAGSAFVNATGLSAAGHFSTARDMAELSRRLARDFPDGYRLFGGRVYTHNGVALRNRNGLLETFAGADGVKTGYTKAAGYCLAASAERYGRRLVAVVLGAESARAREEAAAELLTYGFNRFHNVRLFAREEARELRVWGGTAAAVKVRPARDGVYTLSRRDRVALRFVPRRDVFAPVARGEVMGELRVMVNGRVFDSVAVAAEAAVGDGGGWRWLRGMAMVHLFGHGDGNVVFSQW